MVKYLVEQCAATVDLMDTATGNTALLVAASKNNVTILQYLISMGAKTNHVNMVRCFLIPHSTYHMNDNNILCNIDRLARMF